MDKKTQTSDTGDTGKQKPYFDKNKHLSVWIPPSLYEWFQQYLEKQCYRKSPSERFRVFLFSLQEQEQQEITIANSRKLRDTKLFEQKPYLQIPEEEIWVKGLNMKRKTPKEVEKTFCYLQDNLSARVR